MSECSLAEPLHGMACIPPQALARLKQRRDGPGLLQLLMHAALLASGGAGVLASAGTLWMWPAMLVQGVACLSLFAALHECVHGTAFASRWLNRLTASVCGFLMLLPAGYFRDYHFAHHRHTRNAELDPELQGGTRHGHAAYLWHMSGLPLWWHTLAALSRNACGHGQATFIATHRRAAVTREARLHVMLYVLVLLAAPALDWAPITLWLGPLLLAEPLRRGWLLAEHADCDASEQALTNTRTTTAPAWLRMLIWQMNYHTSHHLHPAIPFHALARTDALISAYVKHRSCGYLAVHRHHWRTLGST